MIAKKLLVADDSVTIQKVIRLALSNEGYEIQAVSDGNDAIQQIAVFRPAVVLIDVSLPGKSAFEVKRAINEHADLKDVRFVLMSSAFEKVDEVQAEEVEFHARLTKPFDPAHLREILSQVVKRSPASTPAAAPNTSTSKARAEPSVLPFSSPYSSPYTSEEPAPPASSSFESPFETTAPQSTPSPFEPATSMDSGLSRDASDDDIRHLTESTIRISGLDNLKSSDKLSNPFSESPDLTPAPAPLPPKESKAAPSTPFGDRPNVPTPPSNFPFSSGPLNSSSTGFPPPATTTPAQDDLGWSVQEPTLKPLPSFINDEPESTFPLDRFLAEKFDKMADKFTQSGSAYHGAPEEPVFSDFLSSPNKKPPSPPPSFPTSQPSSLSSSQHSLPPGAPPLPQTDSLFSSSFNSEITDEPVPASYSSDTYKSDYEPSTYSAEATAISEKEMETLVSTKVEEALRKMAQSILPGIIEKVVKEEIHRLLSEQP